MHQPQVADERMVERQLPRAASDYRPTVDILRPVSPEHSQAFTEVAQSARIHWHMHHMCGDPQPGSNFAQVNDLYPVEKVSDRSRHYVDAALEHLLMWADHVAPFKFHLEQTISFTLRPTYTLARAALESAAQAVWLLSTSDPVECVRRHLSLIRRDLQEHRKSFQAAEDKERCKQRETDLLEQVAEVFDEDKIRPPNGYLAVLQYACAPDDLDLDTGTVERLWRSASGAAHGMYWPTLELQHVVPGEEYEPGQFRAATIPDSGPMVEMIRAAYKMTQYAALKHLLLSGADPAALVGPAMRWLTDNVTKKEDVDPHLLQQLRADRPATWGRQDPGVGAD